ncbi:hypothetical protein B4096_0940 [Heyndrickxia coagulans]|nr:hypothetical protein B4096_0940 [Heyndrickxia coagulans]
MDLTFQFQNGNQSGLPFYTAKVLNPIFLSLPSFHYKEYNNCNPVI